jgi:hypothetical protein
VRARNVISTYSSVEVEQSPIVSLFVEFKWILSIAD